MEPNWNQKKLTGIEGICYMLRDPIEIDVKSNVVIVDPLATETILRYIY